MERFYTIRFKRKTAVRFKQFSKKVSKTYSETLDTIMNFFEWHGFLPNERFEKSIIQELLENRKQTKQSIKRTEASIAIIRDIEQTQTMPTASMLLALFEAGQRPSQPRLIEKKYANKKPEDKKKQRTTVSRVKYDDLKDNMKELKYNYKKILSKISIVKSSFGKTTIKLDLEIDEVQL